MRVGRDVRDLTDRVGDPYQLAEPCPGQHRAVQLELEAGDDAEQVGVAAALAVTVGGALHVGRAGLDGGQAVGDRAGGVVVAVDADAYAGADAALGDDVGEPGRQHAAVGVAQGDDVGTRLCGHPQHLERVRRIGRVAVEEVLGVEEDSSSLGAQVLDGVADHREVLVEGGPQRPLDVAGVGLRHQGDDAAPESRSAATWGSSAARRRPCGWSRTRRAARA